MFRHHGLQHFVTISEFKETEPPGVKTRYQLPPPSAVGHHPKLFEPTRYALELSALIAIYMNSYNFARSDTIPHILPVPAPIASTASVFRSPFGRMEAREPVQRRFHDSIGRC